MFAQEAELTVALTVSDWLKQILVDPISKKELICT